MDPRILDRKSEIESVCQRRRVKRLELFGSAAAGDYVPGKSDIDLLVELLPMPPAEYADTFFLLEADLRELLGTPVDLLEAVALHNPYLRQSIEQTKVQIYEAA